MDVIFSGIGILILLFFVYLVFAIPYAYLKPLYLKATKGRELANKIKIQNLKIKNLLKKEKKQLTETSLKKIILKNFKVEDNFKGLAGITFRFKGFEDFNYTFHIKKKDILINCISLGDVFGVTIDFFVNKNIFEVRKEEVENTTKFLLDQAVKNKHWGINTKHSYLAKSYMKNLLKDENYEYYE